METKHLSYFKVENFKRFNSLEVNDIGQFNLIVGDNNVGKTTLLEALLFDENHHQTLRNLLISLSHRNLHIDIDFEENQKIDYFDFFLNKKQNQLSFSFRYLNEELINLSISKKPKIDLTKEEIDNLNSYYLFKNSGSYLAKISFNDTTRLVLFNDITDAKTKDYSPLISMSNVYGEDLVDFYSQVSLSTSKSEEIKKVLHSFLPNLTSIEINTAIIPNNSILGIRESSNDTFQPLTQYGDGFIKFFRCLLEIDLCEGKRLMIDEIDTGIHYSRMKDFLKKVLQSAKNKNVQLFATTHSKECIEYYAQALKELGFENDGRIIKIADTKSGIKAYSSNYGQFESAISVESEIR